MRTIVKSACAAAVLFALTACSKPAASDDMAWAKSALQRNDRLEVVATDAQARTFTVRMKDSGQLIVVPVDQVVAGPEAAMKAATNSAPARAPDAATPDATASPETAPSAAPPAEAAPAPTPVSTPPTPAAPSPANGPTTVAATDAGGAATTDAGGKPAGKTIDIGEGPHAERAASAKAGSVLASGPGYSITAGGSRGTAGGAASASGAASGGSVTRGAVEKLHDPIICQGSRLLHIDNRNLEFDGDAITAEAGCEIHITNTHISARGVGIMARAANVHIFNSEIDGDSGAIDASDGAQVYAQSSRFKGLTRRLETSAFHDLGGNVWN